MRTRDHRALAATRRAYTRKGATVGSAYVELLRALLAPLGVPVLDASHPAVAAVGGTVLREALTSAASVEQALERRTAELRDAGFEPQVEDMPGLTLVFGRDGTRKRRLAVNEHVAVCGVVSSFAAAIFTV